jgi:type I restriction enzyme S subunit
MSWMNALIEDVCMIKGGKRLPAGHDLVNDITNHPYIRARDIGDGKINFTDPKYITEETYNKISRYIVRESDVIITIVGANIGDIAYVSSEFDGANLTENAVKLTAKKGLVPLFLKYSLLPSDVKQHMQIVASGAAQGKLGLYKIKKLSIPFPPLLIQQKIAGILSTYDDLIENNLKRIKLLEEMTQITYEEWFIRLRFPNYEFSTTNSTTGLPEGWVKIKLKEVLILNYGKALKADTRIEGTIPVYGSSGIIGTHNKALVEGCGIIVGRKGNVGSVFWSHGSFYPIDTVYFVTSIHTLPFIYCALKNSKFNNSDAAVPGLNRDAAYAIEITLPSETIEKQFSAMVEKNLLAIHLLEKQNQRLCEARDILLPRLMAGIIDAESYNPANLLKGAA